MDDLETITTETTEPAQPATAIDLEEARARLAELRADVQAQEIAIAEGELAQAQAAHDKLLEQCNTAQNSFDELDRKVIAQQHSFFAAQNRRAGVAAQIDMRRRNLPKRSYGDKADQQAWREELLRLEAEQGTANAEFGPISTVLITLQAERTAATKALSDLSWDEGQAGVRVANLQQRLFQMKPAAPASEPAQKRPILNGATLSYSSTALPRSARAY
jgi:chromosome segregation ATPase